MPVYGRGRTKRKIPARKKLGTQLVRTAMGKRAYVKRHGWLKTERSLFQIEEDLYFPIEKWAKERFNQTKKPVVVLDWGCGQGKAIGEVARKLNEKVKCYGFSKDSYGRWHRNSRVKFIHETADGLLRYLKAGSVDLIFSGLGIHHLPVLLQPGGTEAYLWRLSEKLSLGGVLVSDFSPREWDPRSLLEDAQFASHFRVRANRHDTFHGKGLFQIVRIN
jgi:SAM-dependent methyltransferase